MQFEALSPGDQLGSLTVEDLRGEDMKLMAALLQDPYPPHFDHRRAEELGYPNLLNQGPSNCSFLLQTVVRELESPADLRSFDLRFEDMAFAGDTVTATATVEDTRVEDGTGLVELSLVLERADGTDLVTGTATARFPRE
jgi:acyl dehydratase